LEGKQLLGYESLVHNSATATTSFLELDSWIVPVGVIKCCIHIYACYSYHKLIIFINMFITITLFPVRNGKRSEDALETTRFFSKPVATAKKSI
jgi:hypothetical protein